MKLLILTILLNSTLFWNIECHSIDQQIDRFNNKTIDRFLKEDIPNITSHVLQSIRSNCHKAMNNQFKQCLNQYNVDLKDSLDGNLKNHLINSLNNKLTRDYEKQWPICCTIYRHHKCITKALAMNSFHTAFSCNDIDVQLAKDILEQNDQSKITNGYCPSDNVQYEFCKDDSPLLRGSNSFTNLILVMGFLTLTLAITLACYTFYLIQQRAQYVPGKLQVLEQIEFEMLSSSSIRSSKDSDFKLFNQQQNRSNVNKNHNNNK